MLQVQRRQSDSLASIGGRRVRLGSSSRARGEVHLADPAERIHQAWKNDRPGQLDDLRSLRGLRVSGKHVFDLAVTNDQDAGSGSLACGTNDLPGSIGHHLSVRRHGGAENGEQHRQKQPGDPRSTALTIVLILVHL